MLNVYKRTLELVKREVKQCYCVCVKVCLCLTAPAQVKNSEKMPSVQSSAANCFTRVV